MRWPAALLAFVLLAGLSPAPGPDEALSARIQALEPSRPEAYFLLAEEVADIADDAATVALVQSLYAMAFELYRAAGDNPRAASCAMGLAGVERLERSRRWLQAVAGTLDRRYALPDWAVPATASISDEAALKAATVLGLARSGEGRDARRLYDQPAIADVLRRYERAIGNTGETGALSRLAKYMDQWPCPQCGNQRFVMKLGDKGPEPRLCPTCRGNPGPRMSEEEYLSQLRFEAALLNGIQRSWAAQITVDLGAPLRDPDPAEIGPIYGADTSRPYYRGGKWVERP
jgi:hypothetical protein